MKLSLRRFAVIFFGMGTLLLSQSALGQQRDSGRILPLVRLKLYETGVAYFERQGELRGATNLPVPTPHLDDALSSLVIWSQGEGATVDAIRFASTTTEDGRRALSGLPAQEQGELGFYELVEGLRGVNVRVQTDSQVAEGRILAILKPEQSGLRTCEKAERTVEKVAVAASAPDCLQEGEFVVTMVSRQAEVLRFVAREIVSIRPLAGDDARRLQMAAEAPTGAMQALEVAGRAKQPVTLGYIAESPLWRASYRVVLPTNPDEHAKVQAWALIHNDTDEAWKNLAVELISGQPDSFLFPFAAPRYAHRRLVTPEQQLPSVRQLARVGADDLWDQGEGSWYGRGEGVGLGSLGSLGLIGIGEGGGGTGESALLSVGNLAQMAPAEGDGVGALYRYSFAQPVELGAHQSALLPLLEKDVDMQRVTQFEPGDVSGRSVLVFRNDTGQTLPAGVVTVFQSGAFSGETALPRLSAGASGRMSFGVDLDVELQQTSSETKDSPQMIHFRGWDDDERDQRRRKERKSGEAFELSEHYLRRTTTSYRLHNRSAEDRRVQVRMDLVNNSKLSGADKVVVSVSDKQTYAEFFVKAGQSRQITLISEQGLVRRRYETGRDEVAKLSESPHLPEEQKKKLQRVVAALDALAVKEEKKMAYQAAITRYSGDLARLHSSTEALARLKTNKEAKALAADILKTQERLRSLEVSLAKIHLKDAQDEVKRSLEALN